MSHNESPPWLTLPFDWYILENWPTPAIEDDSLRRQKHIELGRAYAAFGHEGRRPYASKAYAAWLDVENQTNESLPPSRDDVPKDLLTEHERQVNSVLTEQRPAWIRTDYGPGTDERFQEMLRANDEYVEYVAVLDNARYDGVDDQLDTLFAFCPFLLGEYRLINCCDEFPFDSEEIQDNLFAASAVKAGNCAAEDGLASAQICCFIADAEAMRTGFVRWITTDQYGVPLFDERIQPWAIQTAVVLQLYDYLDDRRRKVRRGFYGDDPRYGTIVWPWTPPGVEDEADQRGLDGMATLNIHDGLSEQARLTTRH